MRNTLIHQNSVISFSPIRGTSEAYDRFGSSLIAGDFNGDGKDDLTIGVPGEDLGYRNRNSAGAINTLYSFGSGLSGFNNQMWSQDSLGIRDVAESYDRFGSSLTKGDFNGDGKDDVAVGVVGENASAGAVNVLYGSFSGLRSTGNQYWTQDSPGIVGTSEAYDRFGASLTTGDFNGDGKDDLAIGVTGEDLKSNSIKDAGAVNVLYGSNSGLTSKDQFWDQNSSGIKGKSEADDNFGASLAAGDFDGDGKDDLAVGITGEDIKNNSIKNAGAVGVLYGSNSGLTSRDQFWSQDSSGIAGKAENYDRFGSSLAVGDFNGDGKDDLAVGVDGEDVGSIADAGAVNILYGSSSGLTSRGNHSWHQDRPNIKGGAEAGDRFGSTLAVGDFNGDGKDDLAIGVTGEDIGTTTNAGAVNIIYGSVNGLTAFNNQIWHQDSPGIADIAERYESFGSSLSTGDFNSDGFMDLAIGVSGENVGGIARAGAVQILYGSRSGLRA